MDPKSNQPDKNQSEENRVDDLVNQLAEFDDSIHEDGLGSSSPDDHELAKLQSTILRLERHWPRASKTSSKVAASTSDLTQLGAKISRFEIQSELGRGGFGVVFLARDPLLDRLVALKVPRPDALVDENLQRRFATEAALAASLDHPSIVPIYEANPTGLTPYITSAYCEGPDLGRWLQNEKSPVPPQQAAAFVAQLAKAVQYAHEQGVLHRDLKPSNILLEPIVAESTGAELADYQPRLTDFGLAKLLEGSLRETQSSLLVGTPLYMAPEQLANNPDGPTEMTDVYALGVVLFELLTLQTPFDGDSYVEVLDKIRELDAGPIGNLNADVSTDLETICHQCLEKQPSDRYRSAAALSEDLSRFLAGEPILARPLGSSMRLWRWCRRRPVLAALWTALITSVVLGSIVATHFAVDASHRAANERSLRTSAKSARQAEEVANEQAQEQRSKLRRQTFNSSLSRAHALLKSNAGLAIPTLENHELCPPALHDISWRFLYRHARQDRLRRLAHPQRVTNIAVSPAGDVIVSGGYDEVLRVWGARDGELTATLTSPKWGCSAINFSPDGKRFVTRCRDVLTLWDADTHEPESVHEGVDANVLYAFSPDNTFWWLGCSKHDLTRARLGDNRTVATTPPGMVFAQSGRPTHGGSQALITPDGKSVVLGCNDAVIRIYDVATGKLDRSLEKHRRSISMVFCSKDGARLVSQSGEGLVVVWSLKTGEPIFETRSSVALNCVAFSPDGSLIACSQYGGVVSVWNVDQNQGRELQGHSGDISALCFSHDSRELYSGSRDGTIRWWNLETPKSIYRTVTPEAGASAMAFDSQSNLLVGTMDGQILKLRPNANELSRVSKTSDGSIEFLAVSPDRRFLATCDGEKLSLIDASNPGSLQHVDSQLEMVKGMQFSPTSDCLIYNDLDLYRVPAPYSTEKESGSRTGELYSLAVSQRGDLIATGTHHGAVVLFKADTLKKVGDFDHHGQYVHTVAFSHRGDLLASGGHDRTIAIWDVASGELVRVLRGHTEALSSIALDPSDSTLISCDRDGIIIFWDLENGQQRIRVDMSEHEVNQIAIDPNGETIAALGNGSVFLWDTSLITEDTPPPQ